MDYNQKYSNQDFYWGLKPHELVLKSIEYLKKDSKILDLGCGEGKDSFFLAKQNFDVTSVDISEIGIKKLNQYSKINNLNIKTHISDIKSYLTKCESFDFIYAINILQLIDVKNVYDVINNMKEKTKPNGYNIIASFIAENEKQKEFMLSKNKYFFDEGELKKLYSDWKILFYEEKLGDWETHGEKEHRHYKVNLITQK